MRFIPTCMGNAVFSCSGDSGTPVHPHVHGERTWVPIAVIAVIGSSPRAWGTHMDDLRADGRLRFIPTCMGNAY